MPLHLHAYSTAPKLFPRTPSILKRPFIYAGLRPFWDRAPDQKIAESQSFLTGFFSFKLHRATRYVGCSTPSPIRSDEHTSELQSLMRSPYAVFCLKRKNVTTPTIN